MKEDTELVVKIEPSDIVEVSLKPESHTAGGRPMYIYVSPDLDFLLYSCDLGLLLKNSNTPRSLAISRWSLSLLLQSGAIPPPGTAYEDIFIVENGSEMRVRSKEQKLDVAYFERFPFYRESSTGRTSYRASELLEKLYSAVGADIKKGGPSFLFHSAGKDSNAIALALAEAGLQREVRLVCYKASGPQDESHISKAAAKRLGFGHSIIDLTERESAGEAGRIKSYFESMPLPGTDNATLAYPLYSRVCDFRNSTIIDGMGNDVYIGHIPGKLENSLQRVSSALSVLSERADKSVSESFIHMLYGSRIERVGFTGFSYADVARLNPAFTPVKDYWQQKSKTHKQLDYIDLRAKFRGGVIDTEVFMRKVKNFAHFNKASLIFPWTDYSVADYVFNMPEEFLFDKKRLRNKLFLRRLLNERLGLDSDSLGKLGYAFDYWSVLEKLGGAVDDEILSCWAWDTGGAHSILSRLRAVAKSGRYNSRRAKSLIHRLFLVSAWLNHCSYVAKQDFNPGG